MLLLALSARRALSLVVNMCLVMSLSNTAKNTAKHSDPALPKSIIIDGINPRDFRELNIIYCCEQCSYFSKSRTKCALGFVVEKHMRQNQLDLYYRTGKMAMCRSQEID